MKLQKRLAAEIFGCSKKKVVFDSARISDIKEAITKEDIRKLIAEKAIVKKQNKGVSRARANKIAEQKKKGRRKRHGSRKGSKNARAPKKERWVAKIRKQRDLLKSLKKQGLITQETYKKLYLKAKGGFFRSRGHLNLYIKEHGLIKK